jgi:prepilin-type N-terminal cleavage/methylation domain-containing protein
MHTITLQPLPLPSPRGHKFLTCVSPVLPFPRGGTFSTCRFRPAFTLVELLVVIGIIALLAAMLTPVVMRSLASARNAAIKAEIDMLHMAIMNYQSEYGVLPPCIDSSFSAGLYQAGGQATKHLKRIFPRCGNPTTQLNNVRSPSPPVQITPVNALVAWLSGYTTNPASPLNPASARVKLFDFDQSRIDISGGTFRYFPSGKRNSPYVYVDSGNYVAYDATPFSDGSNSYRPEPRPGSTEFFNSDTFQILSAGRDEVWGNDDDLSNFWPRTRREYRDSLKD